MGSLSNLYISQSYQSLIHFSTDNSASANLVMLQDGVGQDLHTYVNTNGDLLTSHSISSSIIESTYLVIKNKIELTGSIDIDGPVTASSAFIETDLIVSGTLYAKEVHTLIESSSIIFSTGSNILGDSIADVQRLNGTVIVSGSEEITGSLQVTNNISSSTISGIGNVTLYSQSVDYRLDNLEAYSGSAEAKFLAIQASTASLNAFTQSANSRLNNLESKSASVDISITNINNFTASQNDKNAAVATFTGSTYINFSSSVDFRLDELESWSSSLQTNFVTAPELQATASFLQNQINQKLDTASFNSYTQSFSASVATSFSQSYAYINSVSQSISSSILSLSASIEDTDYAQTVRIDGLASFTGSYATTGSNTFRGNEVFSGSVRGQVFPITISSNTASMDCSLGNFFTLTLPGGTTRFEATNILPGETLSLKIINSTTSSVFTGSASVKFPSGFAYVPTAQSSSTDIITFLTFDNSAIYAVAANYFV